MKNNSYDPRKVSVSIEGVALKGIENGNIENIERKFNDELYMNKINEAKMYDEPPTIEQIVFLAALYLDYQTESYDLLHTRHVKDELGRAVLIERSLQASEFAINLRNRLRTFYRGYEHEFNRHLVSFDRLSYHHIKQLYMNCYERGYFKFIEGDE